MDIKALQLKHAFSTMTIDVINEVLSYSENLSHVISSLSGSIKELSGSKTIIMMQYISKKDKVENRLLGVTPKRFKKLFDLEEMSEILTLSYDLSAITICDYKNNDRLSILLNKIGYPLSTILPLEFGTFKIGTVFILGVHEKYLKDTLQLQKSLAKTIAIVLRNSLLIEEQKDNIQRRKEAEAELRKNQENLEEIVKNRTVDLININHELEQVIIEQKQAEKALKESEERYRRLTENARDIIFRVTLPNGICEYINPAVENILGYTQEEFHKIPFFIAKIIHPNWRDYLRKSWANLINGTLLPFYEYQVIDKFAKAKWLHQRSVIVYDRDNKPIALEGIMTDVTERKQAEEEVKNLNNNLEKMVVKRTEQLELNYKEWEALSYSISHDLRAPLRAIDGYSQAIIEDYGDKLDGIAKNYLERMRKATQRLGIVMDEQLKLFKILRNDLNKKDISLSDIVNKVISNIQTSFPKRNINFIVLSNVLVVGDPGLIRVVMENLLFNSYKFTKYCDNPVIEFGMVKIKEKNTYFVKDNGIGFDMSFSNKLFKPFQQLHISDKFEGYGVGLATVKRIIDRHGGKIWAESIINKGATFYFTLDS